MEILIRACATPPKVHEDNAPRVVEDDVSSEGGQKRKHPRDFGKANG